MIKKELIAVIEKDGLYYNVKIDKQGQVTGVPMDQPSHYHKMTNTGGRRFIGWADEIKDVFFALRRSKMNTEYAKKSWQSAGLTDAGLKAVGEMIDKLAANIAAGKGKWDAYERFATYSGHDPRGSLELLMAAVKQTTV